MTSYFNLILKDFFLFFLNNFFIMPFYLYAGTSFPDTKMPLLKPSLRTFLKAAYPFAFCFSSKIFL